MKIGDVVEKYIKRIRDLREDNDLTQTQIANILEIQQTVYSRYERGTQNIPLEHLIKLAVFYKTTTDYILNLTDNPLQPDNYKM